MATRIASSFEFGYLIAALSLLGVSGVIWLALYAILKFGFSPHARQSLAKFDHLVLGGLVVASLLPIQMASSAAVFGAAVYLLFTTTSGQPLWRVAVVALATTGPLLWGPLSLSLLGPEITRIEALIVGTVTGLPTQGNVYLAVDGHTTFIVAGGCSALANISLTLLVTAVLTQLLDIPLSRRLVPVVLTAVLATIAVNSARLAAVGYFPQHFEYLHVGFGRQLFGWAGLIAMGAVVGFGLYRAARPAD